MQELVSIDKKSVGGYPPETERHTRLDGPGHLIVTTAQVFRPGEYRGTYRESTFFQRTPDGGLAMSRGPGLTAEELGMLGLTWNDES